MKRVMKTGRTTTAVMLLIVLIVFLISTVVLPVKAVPLDTYHSGWKLIRETADEDGAAFGAVYDLTTSGDFAHKDSSTVANGGPYQIRSYYGGGAGTEYQSVGGAWAFALCGKNYDVGADNTIDNTFSFNIIGWSRINGMLQVIAEGDCVLGTQAVITYPDDGADALGALVDESSVTYTDNTNTFTVTNKSFDGTVAGMMVYVTGSDLTDGYYAITMVTDANNIICSGMSSSGNNTDSTVQCNPVFWADTINLDETTKWPSVAVYNSGDNEMAFIVVDMTGLEWVQFVVYDALPEETGEAGDVTVFGRLY